MGMVKKWLHGTEVAIDEDTSELMVKVSGLTFDKDIDIGDVHLLDKSDAKVNPASDDGLAVIANMLNSQCGNVLRGSAIALDTTATHLEAFLPNGAFDERIRRVEIQNCDNNLNIGWAYAASQPAGTDEMGVIPPGLILPVTGSASELGDLWVIGSKTDHRVYVLEYGG